MSGLNRGLMVVLPVRGWGTYPPFAANCESRMGETATCGNSEPA